MPTDPIIMVVAGMAIAVIVGAAIFRLVNKAKKSGDSNPTS